MKRISLLTSIFVAFIFLISCSNTKDGDLKLVASEKNLPFNFHEVAFQREEVPYFMYLVKRVDNQTDYEAMWDFFRLKQQIPKVNFDENDIFFIGVEESSTCPYKLGDTNINVENHEITIHLLEPKGPCTSDATPRTFVFELDKNISKHIKDLIIVQSGVKTNIPLVN